MRVEANSPLDISKADRKKIPRMVNTPRELLLRIPNYKIFRDGWSAPEHEETLRAFLTECRHLGFTIKSVAYALRTNTAKIGQLHTIMCIPKPPKPPAKTNEFMRAYKARQKPSKPTKGTL